MFHAYQPRRMPHVSRVVMAVAAVSLAVPSAAPGVAPDKHRPNIVVIWGDDRAVRQKPSR